VLLDVNEIRNPALTNRGSVLFSDFFGLSDRFLFWLAQGRRWITHALARIGADMVTTAYLVPSTLR
jgi:hypothetical protein